VFVPALAAALASGCASRPSARDAAEDAARGADSALSIPVAWLADSARGGTMPIEPPPAVWIARVTPSRPPSLDAPLPEPMPDVPQAAPPPALEVDPGLKPPIPRGRAPIGAPPGHGPAHVELDVQVLEDGRVGEVAWAGGSRDPDLVEAATSCARAMTFYPALRGEQPVAVWCRQRFDFGR